MNPNSQYKSNCSLKGFKHFLFSFSLILSLPARVLAQLESNEKSVNMDLRSSDKLDIKKLEQKYWAAKDDDFSVVQNRKYVKAERFFLTTETGIPFNDPYSTGTVLSFGGGYFFNERWGVELFFSQPKLSENSAVTQFIDQYGAIPDHNFQSSSVFASAIFVPFYAKMSFLDKSIIYFDMGLSAGLGQMNYEVMQMEGNVLKSAAGFKLGFFQQIFFSDHFAFRVDLNNTWSDQSHIKYYSPGTNIGGSIVTGNRDLGNSYINDTSLIFGLTYWH